LELCFLSRKFPASVAAFCSFLHFHVVQLDVNSFSFTFFLKSFPPMSPPPHFLFFLPLFYFPDFIPPPHPYLLPLFLSNYRKEERRFWSWLIASPPCLFGLGGWGLGGVFYDTMLPPGGELKYSASQNKWQNSELLKYLKMHVQPSRPWLTKKWHYLTHAWSPSAKAIFLPLHLGSLSGRRRSLCREL
jgi:hypothetical protein